MEFLKDHMVTKEEFGVLRSDVDEMRAVMVTKDELVQEMSKMVTKEEFNAELAKTKLEFLDAMDDKFLNLKTDLVTIVRKEDHKIVALVGLLKEKHVLSDHEAKSLLGMEPFPQISLL